MNLSFPTGIPRLLRGQLVKGEKKAGFSEDGKRGFPVRLGGGRFLGREFTFKFLRISPAGCYGPVDPLGNTGRSAPVPERTPGQ